MIVTREVRYSEEYLPPRCRNMRSREVTANFSGEIKEVNRDDAPVAITQYGYQPRDCGSRNRTEYHWYDKRLFSRVRLSGFVCLSGWGGKSKRNRWARPSDIDFDRWRGVVSPEQVQQKLDEYFRRYLLIDGKLYREIGEPRYCIYTLGLGHNHGSTFLSVDNHYNSNIAWSRYFRCDEMEKALATHKKIALARGGTNSVPSKGHAKFEIMIPKAVRLHPKKDHGEGDDFINKAEAVIQRTKDPTVAAFGLMALATR